MGQVADRQKTPGEYQVDVEQGKSRPCFSDGRDGLIEQSPLHQFSAGFLFRVVTLSALIVGWIVIGMRYSPMISFFLYCPIGVALACILGFRTTGLRRNRIANAVLFFLGWIYVQAHAVWIAAPVLLAEDPFTDGLLSCVGVLASPVWILIITLLLQNWVWVSHNRELK